MVTKIEPINRTRYIFRTTLVSKADTLKDASWIGKIIEIAVPLNSQSLAVGRDMKTGDLSIWWLAYLTEITAMTVRKADRPTRKFLILSSTQELEYAFFTFIGSHGGQWVHERDVVYEERVFIFEITRPEKEKDAEAVAMAVEEIRKKYLAPFLTKGDDK